MQSLQRRFLHLNNPGGFSGIGLEKNWALDSSRNKLGGPLKREGNDFDTRSIAIRGHTAMD